MGHNFNNTLNLLVLITALCWLSKCEKAKAAEVELGYNLFTVHTVARSKHFENKIDSDGIAMTNPMTFLKINNVGVLWGKDSVNSEVLGIMYFIDLTYGELVIGGYSHQEEDWKKHHLKNDFAIRGDFGGIIPIIGYNASFIIYESKEYGVKIKLNNIITPATFNSFLGVSKTF